MSLVAHDIADERQDGEPTCGTVVLIINPNPEEPHRWTVVLCWVLPRRALDRGRHGSRGSRPLPGSGLPVAFGIARRIVPGLCAISSVPPSGVHPEEATELPQRLGSGTAGELIPGLVRQGLQALIEAEAAAALGANRHQRTDQCRGHRNGTSERLLATPSGDLQLRIPGFRAGSLSPTLLEPRRRVDRALWAVVREAYVSGVSTRKVDELLAALDGRDPG